MLKIYSSRILLLLAIVLLVAAACRRSGGNSGQTAQAQPAQSTADIPGGSGGYKHGGITQNKYGSGDGEYWIFEPADSKPVSAPVIVFIHGWGGMSPNIYGGWIEHLVKRGNIVIYPRYQENLRTNTHTFSDNAIAATKAALQELQQGNHVKAQLDKFAVVGHSVGGILSANLAATAQANGLPKVRAFMSIEPGKTWTRAERISVPLADLSAIPKDTLMLTVIGDQDRLAKDIDAKKIFNGASQVPLDNKDFITMVSDDHGTPPVAATHFAPASRVNLVEDETRAQGFLAQRIRERLLARQSSNTSEEDSQADVESSSPSGVDVLDYNGLWKLFDGLTDAAFFGKNRQYALGNTPEQTSLGSWNDGVAIKPMKVTKNP